MVWLGLAFFVTVYRFIPKFNVGAVDQRCDLSPFRD